MHEVIASAHTVPCSDADHALASLETLWLFHEHQLLERAIEQSSLDIHLV
jgi:hypothetical protein